MGFNWSVFAKVAKSVGKGAKWAFNHSDEIDHATKVGEKIHEKFTTKKHTDNNEPTEDFDTKLHIALESYNERLCALESQNELLSEDLDNLKEHLKQIYDAISALKEESDVHKSTTKRNFILLSIFSGIGIIIAILL